MTKYRVKNWRQFQHYKDRNPPWIKLHFSLLSSADWVMLDDASRVLAIACMLIASRSEGEIDGSESGLRYIKRVAYLNKNPDLTTLIKCGFLESASGCKQMLADARPETETETETDALAGFEKFWSSYPKKKSKGQAEKVWKRLSPEGDFQNQLMHALSVAKNSDGWRKDGGMFIPYPATWLNARGWEDEAESSMEPMVAMP